MAMGNDGCVYPHINDQPENYNNNDYIPNVFWLIWYIRPIYSNNNNNIDALLYTPNYDRTAAYTNLRTYKQYNTQYRL